VKDKGGKCESFKGLFVTAPKFLEAEELGQGSVIRIPANARVSRFGRGCHSLPRQEIAFVSLVTVYTDSFKDDRISYLPIRWALDVPDLVGRLNMRAEGVGDEVLLELLFSWHRPKQNSRNLAANKKIEVLAPSLSEYLGNPCPFAEGSSHAA
jgi:hypothetical protein